MGNDEMEIIELSLGCEIMGRNEKRGRITGSEGFCRNAERKCGNVKVSLTLERLGRNAKRVR